MSPHSSRRRKAVLVTGAGGVAGLLALAGPIGAAVAQNGGSPVVTTSQTVKVQLDPQGKPGKGYVFTQVEAHGTGRADVQVPTSTSGLRNLDGFGGATVKDGKASYALTVNGTTQQRTVANFTKALPVAVEVSYTLDGKPVAAGDLAGRSGLLGVTYHVKNVSATPTEITYQDGSGKSVTETVDVVTPYVGQLQLDLPATFDDVRTTDDRADKAGNGRGGNLLAWTMVLFEPIGQVEQTFGFTAQVKDAAVPAAHIQLLPVVPSRHPELKFGQDGFESGAKTGRDLTAGATQIDANLLKLQAGASQLLAGLTQLQDGANQLHDGLATQALPGAEQLSAGLGQARSGGQQLSDGLSDGVPKLVAGAKRLAAGGGQVSDGAQQLSGGLDQLSKAFYNPGEKDLTSGSQDLSAGLSLILEGVKSLPVSVASDPGYQQLVGGLTSLVFAVDHLPGAKNPVTGKADSNPGILQALQALQFGVSHAPGAKNPLTGQADPRPGAVQALDAVSGGLDGTPGSAVATIDAMLQSLTHVSQNPSADKPGAQQTVALVQHALGCDITPNTCLNAGAGQGQTVYALLAGLGSGLDNHFTSPTDAGVQRVLTALRFGLSHDPGDTDPITLQQAATPGARQAIGAVRSGLDDHANPPADLGAARLLAALQFGLSHNPGELDPVSGQPAATPGFEQGLKLVQGGIPQLVAGVSAQLAAVLATADDGAGSLAEGIAQAGDGVEHLRAGSQQLADGSQQLADGLTGQLLPGVQKLSAAQQGASDLAGGLVKLDDGGKQLASGLSAAADGSTRLADGLTQAKTGDQQIVDGAGQLSAQGTKALVAAGQDAATSYGREFAVMQALNEKGKNAMPYGQPTGATDARAAYDLSIEPVGHVGATNNAARGGLALAVLAAGAALATGLRRVVR